MSTPTVRDALAAPDAAQQRIAELEDRCRELRKFVNCGGAPTDKTCSVDGHKIYGPFFTDESGVATCELHEYRARLSASEERSQKLQVALEVEARLRCELCKPTNKVTDYRAIYEHVPTLLGDLWVHQRHDGGEAWPCLAGRIRAALSYS